MPNYKETPITGTSYMRASRVVCDNNENNRSVQFLEESVMIMSSGEKLAVPAGGVTQHLTADNCDTAFPLLDADGTPTGGTATFTDVYLLLMSLYYHVATQRDINNQE